MLTTLRRIAAVSVTAVAAAALSVPFAAPASAAATVETQFFLDDSDGDGNYGLWKRATPSGSATKIVESGAFSAWELSASRDGSRFVYLKTTLDSNGAPLREQLVVADVGGRAVRVVDDLDANGTAFDSHPVLSPDGLTVVFSRISFGSSLTFETRKVSVASGASTVVATDFVGGVFLDASTLLARSMVTGGWYTIPVSGGSPQAVSGTIPDSADDVMVSPDGTKLTWSNDTTSETSDASTSDVQVADLVLSGGVATVSGTTTVATGLDNVDPAFSRDGTSVYWVKWDGDFGSGDVWSSAISGGTPAATPVTLSDDLDVAIGVTDDGTAPSAVVVKPALLNGTTVTLNWALPADSDLSGVLVKCLNNQNLLQRNVFVPAPLTSYVNTVVVGNPHMCDYTALDRSGNAAAAASKGFIGMKPVPVVPDPTATSSTRASFPVTFSQTYGSNAKYYVDYIVAGTTTWKPWITGASGNIRHFGLPATTNVLATTSTPGGNYTFRVKMVDWYGNSSTYVTTARAVVPFDQTKAALYRGSNVASSNAYLGSSRRLWTTSSYAKVSVVGNRLQVVGMKCPSCGKFAVYDNGTLVATIDSYASTTKVRQVLYARGYPSSGGHTFVIKPKATSGRPNVYLDGFAMRR